MTRFIVSRKSWIASSWTSSRYCTCRIQALSADIPSVPVRLRLLWTTARRPSCAGRTQTKRVGDHGYGGQAHGERGHHGTQQPAREGVKDTGRDRHTDGVVDESEEQVLQDVPHV